MGGNAAQAEREIQDNLIKLKQKRNQYKQNKRKERRKKKENEQVCNYFAV